MKKWPWFLKHFVQVPSNIVSIKAIKVHWESFGEELTFALESFCENATVPFGISDICTKGFSGDTNELPNLSEHFSIHGS